MSKITCDIINDLLPLYAEGGASADTKALVENHLADCPACAARLEKLKTPLLVPPETERHILERIKKKRRLRLLRNAVILVLILVLLIGVPAVTACVDLSVQFDASDITVETTESGQIRLQLSERAKGSDLYCVYTQDEDGNTTVYLSLKNTPRFVKSISGITGGEDYYSHDSLLDGVRITWELSNGVATGVEYSYNWPSVSACDSVILSDSIVAVYYQPNIDLEYQSFSGYIVNLIDTAYEEVTSSDTAWTEEQLYALTYSHYAVPESEERTLIWMKE